MSDLPRCVRCGGKMVFHGRRHSLRQKRVRLSCPSCNVGYETQEDNEFRNLHAGTSKTIIRAKGDPFDV